MAWRIGIDIGGTFTDVAAVEEDTGHIVGLRIFTLLALLGAVAG